MRGFNSVTSVVDAGLSGQTIYNVWRKNPTQTTTAGVWFDVSMSPGNPSPQYYAASPLVAQQMKKSTDGGINHGFNVSPSQKILSRFLMMSTSGTPLPMPFILCDYLMFYPFVDMGTNDTQNMTNSVSLPRYTDGDGVMMMAVSVASGSGTQPSFTVNYTNSQGTANRTSRTVVLNTATANGALISQSNISAAAQMPFIGLQDNDRGVRSVQSVTFTSGTDVGLFALVLVKPLLTGVLLEQTAPCEIVPIIDQGGQIPVIYDDAFLNILCLPNGSVSGVSFLGEIETIWN